MPDTFAVRLRRLTSPCSRSRLGSPGRRTAALLLRLACVALLAWIGYLHLHLWLQGYRQIPTNGPLFLLDAAAGFALAAPAAVVAAAEVRIGWSIAAAAMIYRR